MRAAALILALAACLLLAGGALQAAHPATPQQQHAGLAEFFDKVDRNHDGEIEPQEAEEFVGQTFQDAEEGWGAVEAVQHMQAEIDGADHGLTVSAAEVEVHLKGLKGMTQSHQVADWVEHGLGLPQYAAAFKRSAITALDFPLLVNDGGLTLAQDLGVTSRLHQEQVLRGLKRLILGLGEAPSPPRQLACKRGSASSIRITWLPPERAGHPSTHKFVLQRQAVDGAAAALPAGSTWTTVGSPDDEDSFWVDVPPAKGKYRYRLAAWNAYGPSQTALTGTCGIARVAKQMQPPATPAGGASKPQGGLSWSTLSSLGILLLTMVLKASQLRLGDVAAKLQRWCGWAKPVGGLVAGGPTLGGNANHSSESLPGLAAAGGAADGQQPAAHRGIHGSSSSQSLGGAGASLDGQQQQQQQHEGGNGLAGIGSGEMQAAASNGYMDPLGSAALESDDVARLEAIHRGEQCAEPGCHRRFDRLRDMKKAWQKHYCGLCQRTFCLAHTRISPHGPSGTCGLESKCLCYGCFEELTPAQQLQYSRINRLSSANGAQGDQALQSASSRSLTRRFSSQERLSEAAAAANGGLSNQGSPEDGSNPKAARRRWRSAGNAMRAIFRLS